MELLSARPGLFAGCGLVALDAEFVGGVDRPGEGVFVGFGEADVGHAHASPATEDGEKEVWAVGEEVGLESGGKHEVAVAFVLRCESAEDAAADAEVGGAHVRTFFSIWEAQSEAAEVVGGHAGYYLRGCSSVSSSKNESRKIFASDCLLTRAHLENGSRAT